MKAVSLVDFNQSRLSIFHYYCKENSLIFNFTLELIFHGSYDAKV